jgi:predicted DNA-binding protein with PD1-like motif
MRQLIHPGAATQPRRIVSESGEAGCYRILLSQGQDLLTALTEAVSARARHGAAIQLISGGFDALQYLTGQPDDSGERVATYGPPSRLDGPVRLIGGNAILGRDDSDKPLLHCHAVVVDRAGRVHGGHLPQGACIVAAEGLVATAMLFADGGFKVSYDAETNFSIFQPEEAS